MARRRARDEDGQFLGDDPATAEIDEAWIEDESVDPEKPSEPEPEPEGSVEKPSEPEPAKEEAHTAPAVIPLKTSADASPLPERVNKEEIEAAIKNKLSKRTDHSSDPFVPNTQLENEVKNVAKKQGFPLNRGTEVGARLIARVNRNSR